jgi:O-antigen/teichoic acid export membrane protein
MIALGPAVQRVRAVRRDPLMMNSVLVLLTTILMAAGGAVFWVIAARVATPQEVGLAGSLVSAGDSLALFAQLGLNVALVRVLPTSSRQGSDALVAGVLVGLAGMAFATAYAVVLPHVSPEFRHVFDSPWVVALYALLVAGTAVNVLSDSVFLAIDRVRAYLGLNGVVMGLLKCSLPFALAGAGAVGLYFSVGGAYLVVGVLSLLLVLKYVGGHAGLNPSPELRHARHFAGASYVTYLLTVIPLLVLPLFVIARLGPARGGVWFISFQVVMLLNAVVLAVSSSTYAESERAEHHRHRVVRRGGYALLGVAVAGAAVMMVLAPYFLAIFGDHYAGEGTATLRVLCLAVVGAAFNYWGMLRLRLSRNLRAMMATQLVSTLLILTLCYLGAGRGTVWVAAGLGVGHVVGGVLGALLTTTVAPFADDAAHDAGGPADPTAEAAATGGGLR